MPATAAPFGLGGPLVQDHDLEADVHAVAEVDRGLVLADFLERVRELDLRALELDAAVGLDRREDVGDADRAVEALAVHGVRRDGDLELVELLRDLERGLLLLGGAGGALGLELLQAALGGLGCDRREPLREEEVAGVAGGDLDDLAGLAELLHVVHEHDFNLHGASPLRIRP